MVFMALARRHVGAQSQARNRNANHEREQQKKRVVEVAARKRPAVRRGAPYGKDARISAVVAVARWLRRSAAHISGNPARNASGPLLGDFSVLGPKRGT